MNDYEVVFLKLERGEATIIRYNDGNKDYFALIDAGAVGSAPAIKDAFKSKWNTDTIDLAVCTHNDFNCSGGFYELLKDSSFTINNFWLNSPLTALSFKDACDVLATFPNYGNHVYKNDYRYIPDLLIACYDPPSDDYANLYDLASTKSNLVENIFTNKTFDEMRLSVVGPTLSFYQEQAKELFRASIDDYMRLTDEGDKHAKDDEAVDSKSNRHVNTIISRNFTRDRKVINAAKDDTSCKNASSIILLFEPNGNKGERFLFLGDANRAAITQAFESGFNLKGCSIKVPNHGSKHNLSTKIIDDIAPKKSFIFTKGSDDNPSLNIVSYLSQHGAVYSTHECNGDRIVCRPNTKSEQSVQSAKSSQSKAASKSAKAKAYE